jgi:nucleotide-binding universal stress UspA family protein
MYRVLMPIDHDEERALAQADAISRLPAAADDIEVTLAHVFDDEDTADSTSVTQLTAGKRAQERLAEDRISVETRSLHGDPAGQILAEAKTRDADAIILGGRKRSPLGSLLFGSVTQAIILDASRPVMVTGSNVKEDPTHRCESCGEVYYATPGTTIDTCRNCGGVKVEATR